MNVGRLHYNATQQVTLAGTGVKSTIPSPNFGLNLKAIVIYIDNASVSSPSYAFKIIKYVNGTAQDVTNPISIAAADLATGKVLVYYFDGKNVPSGSKYIATLTADGSRLNSGEAFALQVTTSSGVTTLTGYITWVLGE